MFYEYDFKQTRQFAEDALIAYNQDDGMLTEQEAASLDSKFYIKRILAVEDDEAEVGLQNEIMESFISENDSQYMGG